MFKKILVPLDGSETAEALLPFVQEIAARGQAEVILVTVVQQVGVWDAALTLQVMDKEEEMATDYLADKTAQVQAPTVRSRVKRGDAAHAILEAAKHENADLIAITTHGRSGIGRWLFGSVASKVLESSDVPVFVLHPERGEDKGAPGPVIRKILVPLDGSDLAMSILPAVITFAKEMGASLVLFHSVAPIAAYPGFETAQAATIGRVIDEMQDQAKQILARAADQVRAEGVEVTALVTLDVAIEGILRAADEANVDLIALATHGRGGLGRMVLGSVADGVVRRSTDRPTLVIHPRE